MAVGTTIGFPHGGHATAVKVFESRQAMADGATELDMVINIGQAKGGEWDAVKADIAAVTKVAHDGGSIVKVIFENCFLNDEQKVRLLQNLRGTRCRLREDLDGLRHWRRHHGRPSPDAAVIAATRQAEGRRRNSHARWHDRGGRNRLRPHRRIENGRDPRRAQIAAGLLKRSLPRPHSRFDLFDPDFGANDQGIAKPDEEARVEHAGNALQLTVERLRDHDLGEAAIDDQIPAVGLVE